MEVPVKLLILGCQTSLAVISAVFMLGCYNYNNVVLLIIMFCFTCVMCKLHSLFLVRPSFFNINNSYCRLDSCILYILVFVCRYSEIPNSCVRGNFSVLKFQVVYLKIISEHNNLSFQYFLRGFCNFHRWTYLSTWQYYILHSPLKVSSSKHVALVSVLNDWSCFMICWLEFQKKYTKIINTVTCASFLLYFPCPCSMR